MDPVIVELLSPPCRPAGMQKVFTAAGLVDALRGTKPGAYLYFARCFLDQEEETPKTSTWEAIVIAVAVKGTNSGVVLPGESQFDGSDYELRLRYTVRNGEKVEEPDQVDEYFDFNTGNKIQTIVICHPDWHDTECDCVKQHVHTVASATCLKGTDGRVEYWIPRKRLRFRYMDDEDDECAGLVLYEVGKLDASSSSRL